MASVLKVGDKWRALIRRKGFPAQCKTFRTKAQAMTWAALRQSEIERGEAPAADARGDLTVARVIDAYRELRDQTRPISDTSNEHYMLKALRRGLGTHRVAALTPQRLVDYATMRREEGAGPYTINMDVSKLGTVMRYAGVSLGVVLPDVVGAARPLLAHLRLIGGGGKRERRPTEDELRSVLAYLHKRRGLVYAEAVAFAACSAMRRGEVCSITWAAIDQATRIATIARKHPRRGQVLERVPLLGEAWDIAKRQPATDGGRLFPIEAGTLSKYFTGACRALSIPDLHLHDMRHEGTSRLFEAGYAIEQAALVTGHKDWRNLRRYTNLRPEDLTAAGATPPASGTHPGARRRADSPRSASRRRGTS